LFRRSDKWWVREIERINRAHEAERAQLIATIAHLSDRPLPERVGWTREPEFVPLRPVLAPIADPDQMP
jgi:hypothetical protein